MAERLDARICRAMKAEVAKALSRNTTDRSTFEVSPACHILSARVDAGPLDR